VSTADYALDKIISSFLDMNEQIQLQMKENVKKSNTFGENKFKIFPLFYIPLVLQVKLHKFFYDIPETLMLFISALFILSIRTFTMFQWNANICAPNPLYLSTSG